MDIGNSSIGEKNHSGNVNAGMGIERYNGMGSIGDRAIGMGMDSSKRKDT